MRQRDRTDPLIGDKLEVVASLTVYCAEESHGAKGETTIAQYLLKQYGGGMKAWSHTNRR